MITKNTLSEIYNNMETILEHPEQYTNVVTRFSAGGHGGRAYGTEVTAAELVRCWQHKEYHINCPECGCAANITFWAGNCCSGGYWQIMAYCPNCDKEINYHRNSEPYACIDPHWTRMKEILEETRENINNSEVDWKKPIYYVSIDEAFEKAGWTKYHQFMAGNRWEKEDNTVTCYLGKYKFNGRAVDKEYICQMLNIDTSLRIYKECAAVAPQSINSFYGRAFHEGVLWAYSTLESEEYDKVVFAHIDFCIILEAFEKEGWTHYQGSDYHRWKKCDDRVKFIKGVIFRLNDQVVNREKICRLLHIDPRVVRVAKEIAPYPLNGKYGQAFLDGVHWADSNPVKR